MEYQNGITFNTKALKLFDFKALCFLSSGRVKHARHNENIQVLEIQFFCILMNVAKTPCFGGLVSVLVSVLFLFS